MEVEAFAPDYAFSQESFYGSQLHKCPSGPKELLHSFRYTINLVRTRSIESIFLLSGGITIFGNALLLYGRLTRKRTAILLYGKDVLQARKSALGRILLLSSLWLTNRIATNSRFTASLLPAYLQRKFALLYPSVDPIFPGPTHSDSAPAEQSILFVGRLVGRKGVDDLIRAFSTISRDFPRSRVDIVGDGPERSKLVDLVRELGLTDRVTFYGSLRGEALYRRYKECDFVVMPSKTFRDDVEGFGTVFLEAGLMERPSVGTHSGGIPEAVTDKVTGVLVKEGDVDELAAAIRALLSDEALRRELGRNARSRVLRYFTWEATATQLKHILKQ